MNNHTYVYVAGPLHSSGRATNNIRAAIEAGRTIREMGAMPFVPHLFAYWDMLFPEGAEYWLKMDHAFLVRCQAIFRVPGDSRGADMEERWARERGIPIFTDMEDLRHWLAARTMEQPTSEEFSLDNLQDELAPWVEKNFPHTYPAGVLPYRPLLGIVEEVGELAHSHLKQEQGIRGTPEEHETAGKDALADIFVYMCDYATQRGWDVHETVEHVWRKVVSKRDWTQNKINGKVEEASSPAPLAEAPKTGADSESTSEPEPDWKYPIDQEVRSMSGLGGYGIGIIRDRRVSAKGVEYFCTFGSFQTWVPEGDLDPVVVGVDPGLKEYTALTISNGKTHIPLTEGTEVWLMPNPYRGKTKVRIGAVEGPRRVHVHGLEEDADGKTKHYVVDSYELRPITDENSKDPGGSRA